MKCQRHIAPSSPDIWRRRTWLMGHLFLTHKEVEGDLRVTAGLWAAIAVLGLIALRAAG